MRRPPTCFFVKTGATCLSWLRSNSLWALSTCKSESSSNSTPSESVKEKISPTQVTPAQILWAPPHTHTPKRKPCEFSHQNHITSPPQGRAHPSAQLTTPPPHHIMFPSSCSSIRPSTLPLSSQCGFLFFGGYACSCMSSCVCV